MKTRPRVYTLTRSGKINFSPAGTVHCGTHNPALTTQEARDFLYSVEIETTSLDAKSFVCDNTLILRAAESLAQSPHLSCEQLAELLSTTLLDLISIHCGPQSTISLLSITTSISPFPHHSKMTFTLTPSLLSSC